MSTKPLYEEEAILVDVRLKNGQTVKVDIDDLKEFWAANADEIEITYGKPRRPRKTKIPTSDR